MYKYAAKVIKIVDGDTIDTEIDLGFHIKHTIRLRLAGIDAFEVRGLNKEAGKIAAKALSDFILNQNVLIQTEKKGKYGRYIAEIWLDDINVNQWMIKQGHAVLYK